MSDINIPHCVRYSHPTSCLILITPLAEVQFCPKKYVVRNHFISTIFVHESKRSSSLSQIRLLHVSEALDSYLNEFQSKISTLDVS